MIPEEVRFQAKCELARRNLYEYCKLRFPDFYKEDREYLKTMCQEIQTFIEEDENKFLVINIAPRHGKSLTMKNTVEWMLGINPKLKIMTGSYNETLSGSFAKQVRDTIQELKVDSKLVYSDIFPFTKIKYGEASASMWALSSSQEKNYLATSPTGTATGFGAHILLIDDLIKNAEEAYNENVLDKQWDWFTNTMLSRTEGNWKVIIIMTRWAEKDLAGRILQNYDNVKQIIFPVIDNDIMLCEEILSYEDYKLKTKEMSLEIVEANYNQKPIDVQGKLYQKLKTYSEIPQFTQILNYTDTADTGKDYLCSVVYGEYNNEAYILDVLFTDEGMETTETKTAELLIRNGVNVADIESNNGGRGFARNVQRILKENNWFKTIIKPFTQTGNKEARIVSSSAWVQEHIYFPNNWKDRFPEFYQHINSYQRKGKNKHDDGVDVLAGIYDKMNNKKQITLGFNKII
jgi:predicted phage terminase large subunit-like protein